MGRPPAKFEAKQPTRSTDRSVNFDLGTTPFASKYAGAAHRLSIATCTDHYCATEWRDVTPIISVTAYHQSNDIETCRRRRGGRMFVVDTGLRTPA